MRIWYASRTSLWHVTLKLPMASSSSSEESWMRKHGARWLTGRCEIDDDTAGTVVKCVRQLRHTPCPAGGQKVPCSDLIKRLLANYTPEDCNIVASAAEISSSIYMLKYVVQWGSIVEQSFPYLSFPLHLLSAPGYYKFCLTLKT